MLDVAPACRYRPVCNVQEPVIMMKLYHKQSDCNDQMILFRYRSQFSNRCAQGVSIQRYRYNSAKFTKATETQ